MSDSTRRVPGVVKQFRINLVHRGRHLREVDRWIVEDQVCQQTGDEPVTPGSIEDGRTCGGRDLSAGQIAVERIKRSQPVFKGEARRAAGCLRPCGDDNAKVLRPRRDCLADRVAR